MLKKPLFYQFLIILATAVAVAKCDDAVPDSKEFDDLYDPSDSPEYYQEYDSEEAPSRTKGTKANVISTSTTVITTTKQTTTMPTTTPAMQSTTRPPRRRFGPPGSRFGRPFGGRNGAGPRQRPPYYGQIPPVPNGGFNGQSAMGRPPNGNSPIGGIPPRNSFPQMGGPPPPPPPSNNFADVIRQLLANGNNSG